MSDRTVTVRFKVKDPDAMFFIKDNVEASTAAFFEFGEYARIELDVCRDGKELKISEARFVRTKAK